MSALKDPPRLFQKVLLGNRSIMVSCAIPPIEIQIEILLKLHMVIWFAVFQKSSFFLMFCWNLLSFNFPATYFITNTTLLHVTISV